MIEKSNGTSQPGQSSRKYKKSGSASVVPSPATRWARRQTQDDKRYLDDIRGNGEGHASRSAPPERVGKTAPSAEYLAILSQAEYAEQNQPKQRSEQQQPAAS